MDPTDTPPTPDPPPTTDLNTDCPTTNTKTKERKLTYKNNTARRNENIADSK